MGQALDVPELDSMTSEGSSSPGVLWLMRTLGSRCWFGLGAVSTFPVLHVERAPRFGWGLGY